MNAKSTKQEMYSQSVGGVRPISIYFRAFNDSRRARFLARLPSDMEKHKVQKILKK